ncbi:MAG: TRAP transporter small permease subunit [Alphaproteobacteria bacterium]|nr:MAG: TRAP transporter small permease subunit [Alphaproteobacteria bacterium]
MALYLGLVRLLAAVNGALLAAGRWLAVAAIAAMVAVTLAQVFFRYVLNNALPWPDEAARFAMLWMTGLAAPTALRAGGFVAIDMLPRALPRVPSALLNLCLLAIAMLVLIHGIELGHRHVKSGWLFNSSSLKLPLDWVGGSVVRVKLAWMFMSLLVGLYLMLLVTVELTLREIARLLGWQEALPEIAAPAIPEAE